MEQPPVGMRATGPAGVATPHHPGRKKNAMVMVRVQYLMQGLISAGVWLFGGDEAPWIRAVRALIVTLVVMSVSQWLVHRSAKRRGVRAPVVPFLPALGFKVVVLAVALILQWRLDHWNSHATLIVAVAIFLVTAIAGPRLHRSLVRKP